MPAQHQASSGNTAAAAAATVGVPELEVVTRIGIPSGPGTRRPMTRLGKRAIEDRSRGRIRPTAFILDQRGAFEPLPESTFH